ncbi:class I SAM-dependent methyltransferase [Marispirochaeta aestuarii]|uniref:class I SAM-dependent methyltransferase n=1 Tax=Marispirochaeta aestuarii TaxID=1963862 RepID=UPI002ABD9785|nr:class I SAM-dependent methyltransferase [Marispirochaeta aestuarii]
MKRNRVIETTDGIQEEATVEQYDAMQRGLRDHGLMETKSILKAGISSGRVLELGPGPGYLGLEWLKETADTYLIGVDISPAMIAIAERNRKDYGLQERAEYLHATVMDIPLKNESVDAVFSNGSLHEWENPGSVIDEMFRVLKPGGKIFISDLKRTMNVLILLFMKFMVKGKAIKRGLETSVRAAYTANEIAAVFSGTRFGACSIKETPFGIEIVGSK